MLTSFYMEVFYHLVLELEFFLWENCLSMTWRLIRFSHGCLYEVAKMQNVQHCQGSQ